MTLRAREIYSENYKFMCHIWDLHFLLFRCQSSETRMSILCKLSTSLPLRDGAGKTFLFVIYFNDGRNFKRLHLFVPSRQKSNVSYCPSASYLLTLVFFSIVPTGQFFHQVPLYAFSVSSDIALLLFRMDWKKAEASKIRIAECERRNAAYTHVYTKLCRIR